MNQIKIALVGNPNCGKTTLFNLLTGARQHVGNWPGVTVEKKEGSFTYKGVEIEIIDLPGIYSLSPNSIEEVVTRNFIIQEKPTLVVNIIDGTTLERSLYLTTQLIDLHVPMVLAINMYDEMESKGIKADLVNMKALLGMPVVPIAAKKEKGITELLETFIREVGQNNEDRIHIQYGEDLEDAINKIECGMNCYPEVFGRYYSRWVAIQLLSGDSEIASILKGNPDYQNLMNLVNQQIQHLKTIYKDDLETLISDQRFGFILGIMRECVSIRKEKRRRLDLTENIDAVVLNPILSFPLFVLILWATFQLTFTVGGFFSQYIDLGVNLLGGFIGHWMPDGMLKDLLLGGIISGVGGILVFLPQIMMLFLIIAILEDSGYMARVAFIMDRLMHFLGVHGKSFISLFMGIGCNVPGILAARTLENEEDRKVTVLINPFMSCSARLPIYILIAGMFFGKAAGTVIFSLYFLGVAVAVFTAKLLKILFFRKKSVPFVMELPPYRTPSARSLLVHMWERASMFLKKMGGVILVGSIIIWVLGYYPRTTEYSSIEKNMEAQMQTTIDPAVKKDLADRIMHRKSMEQMENSYIGQTGHAVEPFFKPLGFGWKEGVALITGIIGKEIVVSTISVLYGAGKEDAKVFKANMQASGMTPSVAYGFLVFVLLYVPCLATISAVMKETNSVKWTVWSIFYGIGIGYLLSLAVKMVTSLLKIA